MMARRQGKRMACDEVALPYKGDKIWAFGEMFKVGDGYRILPLWHALTDMQIQNLIYAFARTQVSKYFPNKQNFQLDVRGFESDGRSLHEIPEAVSLINRFIRLGGLPLLVPSTEHKTLNCDTNRIVPKPKTIYGLGAFETWAVANGGKKSDDESLLDGFQSDYSKSRLALFALVECPVEKLPWNLKGQESPGQVLSECDTVPVEESS